MGHAFANGAEAFADALTDRLQGLEPAPALGRMEADALGRTRPPRTQTPTPRRWSPWPYIPYVALAEPWTLEYLIRRRNQSASIQETALRVLVFYQDKKPLAWLQSDSPP